MAHLRLFLVLAALAALGYMTYRQGWIAGFLAKAVPTPEPTLGFAVQRSKRSHHIFHGNRGFPGPLARHHPHGQLGSPGSGPTPAMSGTKLASIPKPGSNSLEIPSVPKPEAKPATEPKLPFPRSFEGCWQAHMTKPDSWSYVRGPVVQGISPTDYVLCFHYAGNAPDVTFSSTAEYPVVSDWVESKVGVEKSHTDVLFSGSDVVVLRTTSSVPLYEKTFGFLPGPSGLITSMTDFHVSYLPDDQLLVGASVVQRCNNSHTIDCDGDVWIRESWHMEFTRQSS
jgi:hypothetical protein